MITAYDSYEQFFKLTNFTRNIELEDQKFLLKIDGFNLFIGSVNRNMPNNDKIIENLFTQGELVLDLDDNKFIYNFSSAIFLGDITYDYKINCSSVMCTKDVPFNSNIKAFKILSEDIDAFFVSDRIQEKIEEQSNIEISGEFQYSTYSGKIKYFVNLEKTYEYRKNPNFKYHASMNFVLPSNMALEKVINLYFNFMRCFSFSNRVLVSKLDRVILDDECKSVIYFSPELDKYEGVSKHTYVFQYTDITKSLDNYFNYLSSAKRYHEYSIFTLSKETFDIYDLIKITSGFEFYFKDRKLNESCDNKVTSKRIESLLGNELDDDIKLYLWKFSKPSLREKMILAFSKYSDLDGYMGISIVLRIHLEKHSIEDIISRLVKARNEAAHGNEPRMTKLLYNDTLLLEYIVFRMVLDKAQVSYEDVETILQSKSY